MNHAINASVDLTDGSSLMPVDVSLGSSDFYQPFRIVVSASGTADKDAVKH
jgi:hypothetical protein